MSGESISLSPLAHPFDAAITVPGSKSYTIRALLLAAMAESPVMIHNALMADDTRAMLNCLNVLGIETRIQDSRVEVLGSIRNVRPGHYELDADLSAATLRFLLALCTLLPGTQVLKGQPGLNRRPIGELVDALRQLGAEIEYLDREGTPPVRVTSSTLQPGTVKIDGAVSSQYISALLMVAPLVGDLRVEITGHPVSKPYLEMTLEAMQAFGVRVRNENFQSFHISASQTYQAESYTVEPDLSSAAYWLAIAALTKSRLRLQNFNPHSKQADRQFIEILRAMGNQVAIAENTLILQGTGVRPMQVDMRDCPDQAQTLAVLAAFAEGVTRIEGLQSLRVKETDRLTALETELRRMGIDAVAEADALTIQGGAPKPAAIQTYGDHRMAMAFAVAGAVLPGITIQDPSVVNKTFPGFWQQLRALGIGVEQAQTHHQEVPA